MYVTLGRLFIGGTSVLEVLNEHNLDKETETLEKFYDSVRVRAAGIDDLTAKQKIIVELYDKFFRNAFPRMTERLGIVYTPVEVVDFIIHSVNDVLKTEFGQSLGSKGVHIIDPFTGTGTFITRLLQSGLINKDELAYKFKNEIHANEIILLAYYIAAINIEQVYHNIMGGDYVPFDGICLTDTFALYEKDDLVSELMTDNSTRRRKQKNLDIRVIVGNPPYSAGQESANDDNANIAYPHLDRRISETYSQSSLGKGGKRSAYDSYIRALRWASDRIGNQGVIGFITNSGWLDSSSADGLRKCLSDEFSNLYVFNLRGAIRGKSADLSKREGQNVFDIMTGVAILILVKNPEIKRESNIFFYDIGEHLNKIEKLKKINQLQSIKIINEDEGWKKIVPDSFYDWFRQRDTSFDGFMSMGNRQGENNSPIFELNSLGVITGRDDWVFNFSSIRMSGKLVEMLNFYNEEVDRYKVFCSVSSTKPDVKTFVKKETSKISWGGRSWRSSFGRFEKQAFDSSLLRVSMYRPFTKIWHYGSKYFNHSFYSTPQFFPTANTENKVICLSPDGGKGFSVLITNQLPDIHLLGDTQCFPQFYFSENSAASSESLFPNEESTKYRCDGITNIGFAHYKSAYPNQSISKEDIFYYIYGVLHSQNYRDKYADNLCKQLPRIPAVKKFEDFMTFSSAGRMLADLHLNYETVEPYPVTFNDGASLPITLIDSDYYVTQMKFASKTDKSTVFYNHKITMHDIPVEAYDYVVNGKPALEWVMERQSVTTHKDSGIVNDANLWATETMGDAAYPLKLFQRVITVSLETMKIVNSLPKLELNV